MMATGAFKHVFSMIETSTTHITALQFLQD